jgi:dienelactone hydrolase
MNNLYMARLPTILPDFGKFLLVILFFSAPANAEGQPPLEAYGKLPGLEQVAISESGRYFAMVATIANGKRLILTDGNKILNQSGLGDTKIRDVDWAGDEYVLITTSKTDALGIGFTADKAEFWQTLVLPVGAKNGEWVFSKQNSIVNAIVARYGVRKVDSRWKGYFGGYKLEKTTLPGRYLFSNNAEHLYQVDLAKMSTRQVDIQGAGEQAQSDWLVDEQGMIAARLDFIAESGEWKIRNRNETIIDQGLQLRGGISLIALGGNGTTVFFSKREGPDDGFQVYEIPLAGGEAQRRFEFEDIDRWFIDHRTGILMGFRRAAGQDNMNFFDPKLAKHAATIKRTFASLNVKLEDWNQDFSRVIVSTNGNRDSGNWWIVDLSTLSAKQLGYAYPAIGPDDVGQISTFAYKAQDGLEMDGILTLPPGREAKNLPAVMLPHGGPSAQSRPEFDWWAQAFASRGYAVFQPNFRGSTNRDASFKKASEGEWGRKMQTDISDGMKALAAQDIIDPERVCIMGASYGGYAALAGVTLQQGQYRCAISVAGISDLSRMVRDDLKISGGNRTLRRSLETEIGKGRELAEISPEKHAGRADAPILLIHGKDDTVVLYNQSTIMANALKKAEKPFEFVTLEGEDHWLSRADTRLEMLQSSMDFMLRHNPPDPAPAQ